MNFSIRPYQKSDYAKLYEICLRTGDSGKDASGIYTDPLLLGHIYVAPYVIFHPELAFIITNNNIPIGYIVGTSDSTQFYQTTEQKWFPPLREKYPFPKESDSSADARIIRLIHKGHPPKAELLDYPAHLHIDILPEGQGHGLGKKLIHIFAEKLIELGVKALHLEVGKKNKNAQLFYEKVGFNIIKEFEYSIAYGMQLTRGK
ncbi:MAG: GNAT family N-acetyltransferase [Melioribacteraceae bacterium]|nr:GNAT family N-acetyltransferase [Melioribacteraceae bacterium]